MTNRITASTPATITSTKGSHEGTVESCVAWHAEYQGAYATIEVARLGEDNVTVDVTDAEDLPSALCLIHTEIVGANSLLASTLLGRASVSTSRDEAGRTWIWAGHLDTTEPGDGTRECEILREMGLLGADDPTDGYHVYPVTQLGALVRAALR